MNNEETHLITYYNSPTTDLNIEMLEYIEKTFKNYIICGDSNSKNKAFGCKENNKNGNSLIDFISNNNAIILNNKEPTFFRDYINYTEILDLLISSIGSYRNIKNFEVCIEIDLFSGHYPIKIDLLVKINNSNKNVNSQIKIMPEFDYSRPNWKKFKDDLEKIQTSNIMKSKNIEEIIKLVVDNIILAAKTCIPKKRENKAKRLKIPKYLRKLIIHRRYLNKN
jgi:hypothetical protein